MYTVPSLTSQRPIIFRWVVLSVLYSVGVNFSVSFFAVVLRGKERGIFFPLIPMENCLFDTGKSVNYVLAIS